MLFLSEFLECERKPLISIELLSDCFIVLFPRAVESDIVSSPRIEVDKPLLPLFMKLFMPRVFILFLFDVLLALLLLLPLVLIPPRYSLVFLWYWRMFLIMPWS